MRAILSAALALLPVALATPATAGDYHNGLTLRCSQCHIMHFSQSHGYNANGTGDYMNPYAGGPFEFLLRAQPNDLCLSCHDNNAIAPDVLGAANTGNEPSAVREAGYLNRLGIEGFSATGHTIDDLSTAPGSSPAWKPEDANGAGHGLRCINCHAEHGSAGSGNPSGGSYRNLKNGVGNVSSGLYVSYNKGTPGTNDLTKAVFQRQALTYDESAMDFNEPDNTNSRLGNWCGGCHTNFHGQPGGTQVGGVPYLAGYEAFIRHPDAGVNIGQVGGGHSSLTLYNAHTNKVKVMSEVGVWSPAGADVTQTCISCHKAHGNGNAFGLIYRSGTGTKTENGDTNGIQLEHLCGQCHVQATAYANPP